MLERAEDWLEARPIVAEGAWLAVVAGVVARLYAARPPLPWPDGSDWPQYVLGAAWIWSPAHATHWPDWRNPAYPYLLGLLRGDEGYASGGQLIARAAVAVIILGTALLARELAGRLAAAAAAITVGQASVLAIALHWVNPYPLVAALTVLALAAGAWAARRPTGPGVAAAAVTAALLWIVDARGLPVALTAIVLALWGALRIRKPTLLLWLGAAAPVLAWDQIVRVRFGVPTLPLGWQVHLQRLAFGEWLAGGNAPPVLGAACTPLPSDDHILTGFLEPCARALRTYNLENLVQHGLLPGGLVFVVALAVVVPVRRVASRRYPWLPALLSFAVPALVVTAGLSWVVYPDRYVLPYVGPLAALIPVAFGRLARRLPGRAGPLFAAVAAVVVAVLAWPAGSGDRTIVESDRAAASQGQVIAWLTDHTDADTPITDCALVDHVLARAPLSRPVEPLRPELPPCAPFQVSAAEHGGVLVVRRAGSGPGGATAPDPAQVSALGWTPGPSQGNEYAVWLGPNWPTK